MVRITAFGFLIVANVQATEASCSSSTDARSLVGAPCTRAKDCVEGAVCTSGVCQELDAQTGDAAGDGGDGGG